MFTTTSKIINDLSNKEKKNNTSKLEGAFCVLFFLAIPALDRTEFARNNGTRKEGIFSLRFLGTSSQ